MKRENRRNILFRYGSIIFVILLLSLRITYKLVDNTVLSADKWNALASKTLSSIDTIRPVRGEILAADGSVLATNLRVYTPCLDFRAPKFREAAYREAIPELADSLAKYFKGRTAKEWVAYLETPLAKESKNRTRAFPIVAKVSYEKCELVKTFPFLREKKMFTGLHVDTEMARVRPYGDMARRSIGAVGVDSVHTVPFGKFGLERSLDSLLTGVPGYSKKVMLTSAIVDWADKPAIDGYDVKTTIDIKMQDILENELQKVLEVCKPEWGTAVILEVGTGDIKAIANLEYKEGYGYVESLNRAVMRYEPGSVVKTLAMLIMLEDGKVPDVNQEITTGASYTINGSRTSDCVKSTSLPVSRVLEHSSNIAMSRMIINSYGGNPGRFYDLINQTGILAPFNSGIAEEIPPFVKRLGNEPRHKVDLTRQAFGYSTEFSPLYMAAIYNAIAGGGRMPRPRLVRGLKGNGVDTTYAVSYVGNRLCSSENAAILRDMLHRVVWGERGTARHIVRSDKVEIAGKTGTVNVLGPSGYQSHVSRLSFCGFFPYNAPKYTCMVLISPPTETWMSPETTSGRVVKNVAEALFARGMLNNSVDYRDVETPTGEHPTYYADVNGRNAKIHSQLGGSKIAELARNSKSDSGVPDVIGLSFRDALTELEGAGYNVTFTGRGYVSGQTPLPGQEVAQGTYITLKLTE